MKLPLTGHCPCGAVRFEVTAPPLLVYSCHCRECQRWSGSAFTTSMPVRRESVRFLGEAPRSWSRVGASGFKSTYWFCGTCGGRVYGEREDMPDTIALRAGTLDDTSWVRPAAHLYMASAQGWEKHDGTPCFERMPEDFAKLAAEWRAQFGLASDTTKPA
jgi:hypothetical protein